MSGFSRNTSSSPCSYGDYSIGSSISFSAPTSSSSSLFRSSRPALSASTAPATKAPSIFKPPGKIVSKQEENNVAICQTRVNYDKFFLHPITLDSVAKDSRASVCFGDNGSVKECGSNIVAAADHQAKAQPKSQLTNFIETPNAQTPSVTVSSDKVTKEELPQDAKSIIVHDADMEGFYAILDAETSLLSLSNLTIDDAYRTLPSEETQKALKKLQDILTKDFAVLLGPDEYSTMNTTLDYLTNLSAEDGISVEIRSLIIEVSKQFTSWSSDYTCEGKKIESTTAKLLKADELEVGLETNKTLFREVMYLENELCNELAYLEERKKVLEEQLNAVRASISASQAAKNIAAHTKREIFGKAKILKAQRDELREQVPCLRDEQDLAKKNQENIRAEWSKLGEKFNKSLKHED